jgi:hypothetical protein
MSLIGLLSNNRGERMKRYIVRWSTVLYTEEVVEAWNKEHARQLAEDDEIERKGQIDWEYENQPIKIKRYEGEV